MARVESSKALLVMAVQDLFDGETAMIERLETLRDNVSDTRFGKIVEADRQRSARQRDVLAEIAAELGADPSNGPNIWLRAILDDSDNDAATIASGPLLDVALVGALRKGKQSERVSYETALALARQLGLGEAAGKLAVIRDEEQACDDALAELLQRLTEQQLDQDRAATFTRTG